MGNYIPQTVNLRDLQTLCPADDASVLLAAIEGIGLGVHVVGHCRELSPQTGDEARFGYRFSEEESCAAQPRRTYRMMSGGRKRG
jgi:hypothetical protein